MGYGDRINIWDIDRSPQPARYIQVRKAPVACYVMPVCLVLRYAACPACCIASMLATGWLRGVVLARAIGGAVHATEPQRPARWMRPQQPIKLSLIC